MTKFLPCDPEELRRTFLFEKLTDEQLDWLCREGHVEQLPAGRVYTEGEPARCFYVLLDGEVALSRLVGGDDVETNRTNQIGVYSGAWQAYLGDRVPQVYNNSMRAVVPSRFFVLDAEKLAEMMREWFPMALHMLEGLFFGIQNVQQTVAQRERLLALGSLSAGLTHELNNPAAAAVRATSSLRDRVAGMRHKLGLIAMGPYDRETLATLIRCQEDAVERVAKAAPMTPMEASDREDEIVDWLEAHDIAGGWDIAPTFVQAGLDVPWLDQVAATVDQQTLAELQNSARVETRRRRELPAAHGQVHHLRRVVEQPAASADRKLPRQSVRHAVSRIHRIAPLETPQKGGSIVEELGRLFAVVSIGHQEAQTSEERPLCFNLEAVQSQFPSRGVCLVDRSVLRKRPQQGRKRYSR